MSLSGFDVVHDSVVGGQDDETELSGRQDLTKGLLEVSDLQVESWGDDSALVDSSVQFNDDLAISLIINNFKFVDVTYEELDHFWEE